MIINSDINVLGSLTDWSLINVLLNRKITSGSKSFDINTQTSIKTDKSIKRFQNAITSTLIKFCNSEVEHLIRDIISCENISRDSLLLIYWNASYNHDLLNYLNSQVYFVAFYSGRVSIKTTEVVACLKDLQEREIKVKKWSESSIQVTASKYLTLLKKINLMEGSLNKTIVHPYLNDKMFVLFIYWITAIETKSNLLESKWLKYSFCERSVFIERLMKKKFSKFFQLVYTGDKLKIETSVPYEKIYDAVK